MVPDLASRVPRRLALMCSRNCCSKSAKYAPVIVRPVSKKSTSCTPLASQKMDAITFLANLTFLALTFRGVDDPGSIAWTVPLTSTGSVSPRVIHCNEKPQEIFMIFFKELQVVLRATYEMAVNDTSIILNTNTKMPLILLGTYRIRGFESILQALDAAFAAGYRGLDTASVYRNEKDIGKALQEDLFPKHNLTREDIFITSKLGPKQQGYEEALAACRQSMENLRTSYLDLFLIHWPGTQGQPLDDESNAKRRLASWRGLQEAQKRGWVRAIGVSNYMQTHLEELLKADECVPAVLQIEHHPMLNQKELVEFCKQRGIHYQAYSSLGTTENHSELCENPTIMEIAKQHCKTPAQVLLRWAIQQNISVLPKSTNPRHIEENIQIFDWNLTDDAMVKLSSDLNCGHHFCWNPNTVK